MFRRGVSSLDRAKYILYKRGLLERREKKMEDNYALAAKIRVRYSETDKMGIVYNANYLDWFEVTRTELCRGWGKDYKEWEAEGLMLPVVEAYCRYKNSARYDDVVELWGRVADLKVYSIKFEYRIARESDGKLLATGWTRHGCTDAEGRLYRGEHPFYKWVLSVIGNEREPQT